MSFYEDETGKYVVGADSVPKKLGSSDFEHIGRIDASYSSTFYMPVVDTTYNIEKSGTIYMCGIVQGGGYYGGRILHNGEQVQYYMDGNCTEPVTSTIGDNIHLFSYAKFEVNEGDTVQIFIYNGSTANSSWTGNIIRAYIHTIII